MKKITSILTAILTISALIVNICAVPYSHGGAIGDTKLGPISGYYSLITVFGEDDNGNLLAIGRSANNSYVYHADGITDYSGTPTGAIYIEDVYAVTEYRCGNADDTGFSDDIIPAGIFDNNDYAIYIVPDNELSLPKIAKNYAPGDTVYFYSYNQSGNLGEKASAVLSDTAGNIITYSSDANLNFPKGTDFSKIPNSEYFSGLSNTAQWLEYSHFDYLAPVYTKEEELIGVIIDNENIITVEYILGLIDSQHYIPLDYDEPQDEYIPPYDDVYRDIAPTPSPSFSLSGLLGIFGKIMPIIWWILHSVK